VRIGANSFLSASLIVLLFAFFLSIFVSTGIFYGESYHVVVVLEANPQAYTGFIESTVFCGILPIAASLAFFIITCIKGRETPTDSLRNWLLIILGGFCALWGYLYFNASYVSYSDTIVIAHDSHISNIDGSLLAIYTTYGLVGILWLITGLFFIIMSAHKLLQVKKSLQ
jgi:hypothetical protein